MEFNLVVCGGTFDHFHKGHRAFLRFVLSLGNKVIIGLTSDLYTKLNKQEDRIEAYSKRQAVLWDFLEKEKAKEKVTIVSIDNLFGQTLEKDLLIDALVVSSETIKGGEMINNKRRKKKLPLLKIMVCPLVKGEDGKVISSDRIRRGEINREGRLYINPQWLKSTLSLPSNIKEQLKVPLGTLITDFKTWVTRRKLSPHGVVTVGDIVTKTCNDLSIQNILSIIDFHVQRKKTFHNLLELGFAGKEEVYPIDNPRGRLTPALFQLISRIFRRYRRVKRVIFAINGEEDLAVLPVVLAAPLGFVVLYGQPSIGVVMVEVTEEQKEKIYSLVSNFPTQN